MTITELSRRDRDRLISLLEGKLSAAAKAKLLARIEDEPPLAEAWERLQATRSLLRGFAEAEPPAVSFRQVGAQVHWRLAAEEGQHESREASPRSWRFVAVASAALLLGAIFGVVLDRSLDERQAPSSVAAEIKPAPSKATSVASKTTLAAPRPLAALPLVINGQVNVAPAGGALERLRLDRPLLPGDRILTSADGQVTFQWADGTGALLGPDSELELRALTDRRQQLALHGGAGRFVIKPRHELPAATRGRSVEVLAGNLRVQVVGTRFAVALTPEHTTVEVSKGKVRAMPYDPERPNAKGQGLLVAAGQRLEVPQQGGKPRLATADAESLKRRPSPYLIPWRSLAHVLALTGGLRVDSRPIGAELRVDSVWVGQTNLLLRGTRGRHLLELWRDGKRLRRHWVQIGQGKPTRVALQLDTVRIRRLEKARLSPAIYRIIRRRAVLIRACYERRLKLRPRLAGQFDLRFEIGRDGRVEKATVDRDTLPDPLVGRCAENAVKRWRFPPGTPTTLVYPFIFKPR